MKTRSAELRAALYARVSSEKQAEANTIASQVAELRRRIDQDGCTIQEDDCFVDDGVSGAFLVRPALERLRDQVAHGALDRLYLLAPDRPARKASYKTLLVDELTAAGVELVVLNHALGKSPEDELLLQARRHRRDRVQGTGRVPRGGRGRSVRPAGAAEPRDARPRCYGRRSGP